MNPKFEITGVAHLAANALEFLKEQSKIVRCQDCKYSEHIGGQGYRCYIWDCLVNHGNGFCNYGERKDNYND